MSYPTKLKLFKAWAKAMEQGATVGKPSYGLRKSTVKRHRRARRPRRTRRARQKLKD